MVGVSEPEYDRSSIHGIWLEGINETKDEARSIETAYHTTKGMMRNAATRDPETGWCYKNGGWAPEGYENTRVVRGKDSRGKDIIKLLWTVNEERAELVRHIVLDQWFEKRLSYKSIRDELNAAGILSYKGTAWPHTSIREICIRALEGVYSGFYYWNRTGRELRQTGQKWKNPNDWVIIENAHPAIITVDEWQELKAVMEPIVQHKRKRQRQTVKTENSHYLLTGENVAGEPMFVCMACGGGLVGNQTGRDHFYYLCGTFKNKGKTACHKGIFIRKEDLESKVIALIKKRFSLEKVKEITAEYNEQLADNIRDQQKAERHIKKSIENVERAF